MAQKKKYDWPVDEWGNPLDGENTREKPDPFGIPNDLNRDEWPEEIPYCPQKKTSRNIPPRWLIPITVGVIILIVVLCLSLPSGDNKEAQSLGSASETITADTTLSTNPTSVIPTASSTIPPTESPTTPDTVSPTASPTPSPTASPTVPPTVSPIPSLLDQNEWYSKELRYYYQQLTENEKQLYDRIYEEIMQFQQQIDRTGFTDLEWEHVRYVLYSDTPELFQWTGGGTNYYQTFGEYTTTYFEPEYRMTQDEYNRICTHIHGIVNDLRKSISSDADDYKKEWIINAWLVDYCTYLVADDKSTAYADASLYIGKSQCSGYSRGFMLLLRSFGIECLAVSSDTHEWNIVRINHRWYVADSTWNDTAEADGKPGGNRCFYWVNVPDRLVTDSDHIINPVPGFSIPQCNSLQDNYAVREGVYIVSGTGNVAEQMAIQLKNAHRSGKDSVLVFIDDTAAIANWENIRDRFYHQYDGYGWALYNPKNQMVFAVWDDT